MKNKASFAALGTAVLLGGSFLLFHNCSPGPVVHQKFPPIGQTVTLDQVSKAAPAKADHEYQNVLIYFGSGGRTLFYDEKGVVQMFAHQGDETPVYEFTPAQLQEMYNTSQCPRHLTDTSLENALVGDALFCNHQLDLSKVSYFVFKKPDGKVKTATSYVLELVREADDLIAISITFAD